MDKKSKANKFKTITLIFFVLISSVILISFKSAKEETNAMVSIDISNVDSSLIDVPTNENKIIIVPIGYTIVGYDIIGDNNDIIRLAVPKTNKNNQSRETDFDYKNSGDFKVISESKISEDTTKEISKLNDTINELRNKKDK